MGACYKNPTCVNYYRENWNLTENNKENNYTNAENDDIHSNEDISMVDIADIPDHEMVVGGFPCQDYSVAKTLNKSAGIKNQRRSLVGNLPDYRGKKPDMLYWKMLIVC